MQSIQASLRNQHRTYRALLDGKYLVINNRRYYIEYAWCELCAYTYVTVVFTGKDKLQLINGV